MLVSLSRKTLFDEFTQIQKCELNNGSTWCEFFFDYYKSLIKFSKNMYMIQFLYHGKKFCPEGTCGSSWFLWCTQPLFILIPRLVTWWYYFLLLPTSQYCSVAHWLPSPHIHLVGLCFAVRIQEFVLVCFCLFLHYVSDIPYMSEISGISSN